VVLKPGVGADQDRAGRAGAANAGEQLIHESRGKANTQRGNLAVTGMEHLAAPATDRHQRVIAELLGVSVGRALLVIAVDLPDEAVDIDHQTLTCRAGALSPRPPQRLVEDMVELAHMPERERPQERPQRRRGHHRMPQHQPGRPGAQHVHVIDAVRAGEHPVHQAHHLTALQRRARSLGIQPHAVVHKLLDTQPLGQGPCQQQTRVGDQTLLIKADCDLIERCGTLDYVRVIVHHSGDLLTGPRLPRTTAEKPCSGGHLNVRVGRNRWHYAVDPGLVDCR
jgi:hypothetical protein